MSFLLYSHKPLLASLCHTSELIIGLLNEHIKVWVGEILTAQGLRQLSQTNFLSLSDLQALLQLFEMDAIQVVESKPLLVDKELPVCSLI